MSSELDYAAAEWSLLRELPFKVLLAAIAADVRGPIGAASKEKAIGARELVRSATTTYASNGLIAGILQAVAADPANEDEISLNDEEARQAAVVEAIALSENVLPILANRTDDAESGEYKKWIYDAAHAAVAATRSGGFLGFGTTKISTKEAAFLDRLRVALALPEQ